MPSAMRLAYGYPERQRCFGVTHHRLAVCVVHEAQRHPQELQPYLFALDVDVGMAAQLRGGAIHMAAVEQQVPGRVQCTTPAAVLGAQAPYAMQRMNHEHQQVVLKVFANRWQMVTG